MIAVLGASLVLVACGGGGSSATSPLPGPFEVFVTDPSQGAIEVSVDRRIAVRFTRTVEEGSVEADSIVVTADGVGRISGTTVLVPSGNRSELRWTPNQLLPEATDHVIQVDAGLRGVGDHSLTGPHSFAFRTETGGNTLGLPRQDQLRTTNGTLSTGRQAHTGTLLPDDRVLIAGGFTLGTAVTATAELYNPTSDAFTASAAPMNVARAGHSATRLIGGQVLIAGGRTPHASLGLTVSETAEVFNPATNRFTAVGTMTTPRVDHAAVLLGDGTVLISGGTDSSGNDLDTLELYNPSTQTFSEVPARMSTTRALHGMIDLGTGKIAMLGGSSTLLRGDVYDLALRTFTTTNQPAQEFARFGAAFEVFDSGAVCMAGGDAPGNVVYGYAGSLFLQNSGSSLDRPRSYATATRVAGDQILVVGGIDFSAGGFVLSTCDVVIEGGVGGSRTFATAIRFPTAMAGHTATILSDGDVLYCGGLNEDGSRANRTGAYIFEIDEP